MYFTAGKNRRKWNKILGKLRALNGFCERVLSGFGHLDILAMPLFPAQCKCVFSHAMRYNLFSFRQLVWDLKGFSISATFGPLPRLVLYTPFCASSGQLILGPYLKVTLIYPAFGPTLMSTLAIVADGSKNKRRGSKLISRS